MVKREKEEIKDKSENLKKTKGKNGSKGKSKHGKKKVKSGKVKEKSIK